MMDNEQLVTCIRAGIDPAANMLQLWQQNKGFIWQQAKRYRHLAEEDDLKQEGYIGLCEAVENWDAERGSFITAMFLYVRGAMLRYCQNNSTVRRPAHMREKESAYKKLEKAFQLQVGREPTEAEFCYYLGVTGDILKKIQNAVLMGEIGSLDSPINGTEEITLQESVAASANMEDVVLEKLQAEQLKLVIWPLVDALPGKQPEVIRLRFRQGKTMKETGQKIGADLVAIRQIQEKALRELRKPSRAKHLRPFYMDYIDTHAYKGSGVERFRNTWTSSTERTAIELLEKSGVS